MRGLGRVAIRVVLAIFIVTVLSAFMLDFLPGDPGAAILGASASPEQVEAFNEQMGFNDPPVERYVNWVDDLSHGDLQRSVRNNQPVFDMLKQRLPVTLELAILAEVLSVSLAIPLGLWSAYRVGSRFDRSTSAVSFSLLSIAPFVMALVLVFVFSIRLGWLPVSGWVRLTDDPLENLRHAALPVLTLVAGEVAIYVRLVRAEVLVTLQEDFVLAARAKGLPTTKILLGHVLRPSSISLITLVGVSLGRLIGGTVIVEQVFALPGLGRTILQAIGANDYFVVQGVVVFVAVSYVLINALVDVSYGLLDPRVRGTRSSR
jgi:peptide/nickel transport system permease protein